MTLNGVCSHFAPSAILCANFSAPTTPVWCHGIMLVFSRDWSIQDETSSDVVDAFTEVLVMALASPSKSATLVGRITLGQEAGFVPDWDSR